MEKITYTVSVCVILLLEQVTTGVNATDEGRESSAIIHLNSSHEGTGVCIGDRVVFRCTVIGPGLLQWAVESINTFFTNPIEFTVLRDMPGTIPDPFPEVTNVSLISVVQNTENQFQGALISEITVLVTSNTLGKHVYCSHGQLGEQEPPSILIQSATLPLPPLLTYSNVSYGIDEYSVRVQWQTLSDDGAVDNYTLTLYRDEIMIEMSLLKANTVEHYISLNYSTNYTFAVYTSNCIGSGNSTYIYIVKAGCGRPSPPVNGSIEEYRSTEEGAEIQFHCDEGYTPYEWNTSQCQDSMWSPDPAQLHCRAGNNTEGSVSRSQATPVMSPTVIPTMMNYTTHSNKQIISVSIIVASLLVIGTGTMMIILLVIFLVRSQSEIRWKLQRRAALRKKPGMNENSYGDIELIADHGTSNSGDGIDLPHSDSNAIINATGGATPSDHSGTSPTSPQLYSEANSGKRMVEVAEDMAISHQHIEPAEYSVPVPSNCTSAVEKPPQTYAEVVIKQCLPPLSLHEQPVTYSVIQVAQAHSPPPDLPPKPPTQPPPPPPLPPALSESLLQESEESIVNHQLDTKINIDLVIQQLQELTPHWRAVGQAAYIEPAILDEIAEHFKGNDSDSFAEVMNQCFIPNDTLWADIGDICQRAGFTELADKLYDSYRTGKLPVEIEDEEVKPLPSDPAPLIPPRGGEKNEDIPPALPPPLAPEDMPDNQPSEHRKPPALPPSTRYPSDLPPRPPKVSH